MNEREQLFNQSTEKTLFVTYAITLSMTRTEETHSKRFHAKKVFAKIKNSVNCACAFDCNEKCLLCYSLSKWLWLIPMCGKISILLTPDYRSQCMHSSR